MSTCHWKGSWTSEGKGQQRGLLPPPGHEVVGTRSLQLPAVGEKWVTPHTWVALGTLPSKTTCPHFPAGAGQLWGLGDPLRKRDLELAAPLAVAPLLPLSVSLPGQGAAPARAAGRRLCVHESCAQQSQSPLCALGCCAGTGGASEERGCSEATTPTGSRRGPWKWPVRGFPSLGFPSLAVELSMGSLPEWR